MQWLEALTSETSKLCACVGVMDERQTDVAAGYYFL